MQKIELLSPAGDLERLKLAVKFGADAVYVGGTKFGMRSNPSNFDETQLKDAVDLVQKSGKKPVFRLNLHANGASLQRRPVFSARAAWKGTQ